MKTKDQHLHHKKTLNDKGFLSVKEQLRKLFCVTNSMNIKIHLEETKKTRQGEGKE